MKTNIPIYGQVALEAVELLTNQSGLKPREAWEKSVTRLVQNKTGQEIGCPRGAFLGLCEDGLVTNIPPGKYLQQKTNKTYAIQAYHLLKLSPRLKNHKQALWQQVTTGNTIAHNGQLDVVIALFEEHKLR